MENEQMMAFAMYKPDFEFLIEVIQQVVDFTVVKNQRWSRVNKILLEMKESYEIQSTNNL
jgi:hypothetical protein